MEPTSEELNSLSAACQKLWDLDSNRLEPGVHYEIDVQDGKKPFEMHDAGGGKFFKRVHKDIWTRPTYLIFYNLLDNYERTTGSAEVVTDTEKREMAAFLDAVCETAPMQYCHRYLVAKDLASPDINVFKRQLYQMWFSFYRRDGNNDTCGFEHVFVGEYDTSDGKLSGFHNWVQFWIEECKGNVDYRGYIVPRVRGAQEVDNHDQLLSVQFAWHGELKPVTTLFIGVSPEFEMALYTLCFLAGSEQNNISIGNYDLTIRCYRIHSSYGDKIGSAFAEIVREN